MSKVQQLEAEIGKLALPEMRQIHDWLADVLEDQLELTDEFKRSIERGKRDIAEGRTRVRRPRAQA